MCQFNLLNFACADLMAALHSKSFEKPWTKDDFSSLLKLSSTKGLVNEKGMIVCSICGEDAEILTLCVSPEYRKQGLATQMIIQIGDYLKIFQVCSLFLEVDVNNIAALNLYKKCGFVEVGRRKDYYKTNQGRHDALVLKKKL